MMNNCEVKLELDQTLSKGRIIKRTVIVQSENENLIECIKSIVGNDCYIAFGEYYANTNLMNFEKMLPYIFSDGIIKWYVPFSEVTIKDFRETNRLNPDEVIHAEIDNVGSGWDDISELISWIVNNWNAIGHFSDVITVGGFIHRVYKWFANNKRVPRFEDVEEAIELQDCWVSNKLMKIFKVYDPELMDCILYSMGYERIENLYEPKLINCDTDGNTEIWGKTTCHHWTRDITYEILQLNVQLTDLKYRLENLEQNSFRKINNKINYLLKKWQKYLVKGECFCFLQLINPPDTYGDIRELKADIQNLSSYVRSFLDIVDDLEEKDVLPLPNEIRWPRFKKPKNDDYYEEFEEYVSKYEILLTKLFLNNTPLKIISELGIIIAYVEQIYDNDVLLQVLSENGVCLGHRTMNIYDIKLISTDTKSLRFISSNIPASSLPSLSSYGTSAREFLIEYAYENDLLISVEIESTKLSTIEAKVIEIEVGADPLEDQLVKFQLFDDKNENDGIAWIKTESIQSLQINNPL